MNPATVLHVVGSAGLEAYGVSRFVLEVAPAMPPERYRLELLFLGANAPVLEESRRRGIAAHAVNWPHPLRIAGVFRTWSALRNRRIDLVHQHYGGRAVTRWLRRLTGAPVVAHMCGRAPENDWQNGPRALDMSRFDAVTAVSAAVAKCCAGQEATVVYPAIPAAETPRRLPAGRPLVVGAAGRLVPLKGLHHLLAAFAALADRFPAALLRIAGDGPERPRLARQARALGIANRVSFHGWILDIESFYRDLDVLVQPSSEEAFGMSAAEAMAQGVPVIAADTGGLAEVVVSGETGLLVPPGDSAALGEALGRVLEDEKARTAMGEAGWQRVRTCFAPRLCAEQLVQVYDRTLRRSE